MGFAIIRRTLEAKTETELSLSFDLFGQYGTMQENIVKYLIKNYCIDHADSNYDNIICVINYLHIRDS